MSKKNIKQLLDNVSISKSMEREIIRTLKKNNKSKGKHKFKKKKKKKKHNKKSKSIRGVEGIDFKTFNIDPNRPSSCRPRIEKVGKNKCKTHMKRIPKMGLKIRINKRCKSLRRPLRRPQRINKGKFMIKHILNPDHVVTPKCNKSRVHFINL